MPMSPEAKEALLKRLKEGRLKTKAAREDAKAKGLPDPKPRKVRKDKKQVDPKEAIPDPLSQPPAREGADAPRPIDAAKNDAVNVVAALPPNPEPNKTAKIDVPNLPNEKGRKKIVEDAEAKPEVSAPKALSTTGKTKKIDNNDLIMNEETGSSVISNQMPGQKESIKKMLKKDKKELKPETPADNPAPVDKTTKNVINHVPNTKSFEGKAPFSFSAVKRLLYQ